MSPSTQPARPRTYLVVSAHPDDADFGVSGTAARLARDGNAVHYVLCTSGAAGGEDPSVPEAALESEREAEQLAAAHVLGLTGVRFLRFRDGELEPSLALRKAITREIRRARADVVLCQDPRQLISDDQTYINHPDHRAAGQATLDAVFPAAGNPRAFMDLLAEGLPAHPVREVWLYFSAAERTNHWVDIAETIDQKIAALKAHASQIGDWGSSGGLDAFVRRWATEEGARNPHGYALAEGFQRIVLTREEPPSEESV